MLALKEDTMLGNIPSDWEVKPLKGLLKEQHPGDWGAEGGPQMYRVIRSTNLTNGGHLNLSDVASRALNLEKAAHLELRKNDILLERSGGGPDQPVGRVGFVKEDMPGSAFSNFLHMLRPDPEQINPLYLKWVLWRINQTGRILRLEQQTTQLRNLHFRDYLTMPLPIPPPAEQAVIVQVLDAVDMAIERTRTAVKKAKEVKRALTQHLFRHGTRGEKLKKTIIGLIPESWEVVTVDSVVSELQYGLSVAMQQVGTMPILRMGDIQSGDILLDKLKYVSLPEAETAPVIVRRGDVLFNRVNSQEHVGKVGIYRRDEPVVFASYLIRVVPNPEKIDNYYLGHLLNSYAVQCHIKRYATPGVQQVNINATNLGKVLIPVPSGETALAQQREIAALLEAAEEVISRQKPVLEAQQTLKKALLQDLLTGKVRVGVLATETLVSTKP